MPALADRLRTAGRVLAFPFIVLIRFIVWCAGSDNPNRLSRSYRGHQNEIERRWRHR